MTRSLLRLVAGEAAYVLIFVIVLFVPAKTVHWPRGWILLATLVAGRFLTHWRLYRVSPELLAERAKGPLQTGQTSMDKMLLPAFMASYAALIAFTAADCFGDHFLGQPTVTQAYVGLLGVMAGSAIISEALSENAYATMVVRHQAERAQQVVDTGVYGWVRHPMYAGVVLSLIGIPIWLGSLAGLVAASIPIGVLVVRILHEERLLIDKLPGYSAYAAKVSRRLIPGIW